MTEARCSSHPLPQAPLLKARPSHAAARRLRARRRTPTLPAESAVRIGLLPASLAGRIVPVGNAAMGGAALILADSENERACARIARMGAHVELGSNPYFMEQYIDCMMLGPAD